MHAFIRDFSAKPASTLEAIASTAAKNCVDMGLGLILVFSGNGSAASAVAKYRPRAPVLVVSSSLATVKHCQAVFGLRTYYLPDLPEEHGSTTEGITLKAIQHAVDIGLCPSGREVMLISGRTKIAAEFDPVGSLRQAAGEFTSMVSKNRDIEPMTTARVQRIRKNEVLEPENVKVRRTKLVCTMGPRCWSEEGIGALLDAGLNIARLNFSHGNHEDHQRVLDRFRSVCAEKGSHAAVLLDTKGPEIRTAMLRDGKDIELEAGQDITVVAVGDEYTTWEGFKDAATGETKIGLSYAMLCQSVGPGNVILLADGSLSIQVVEILSAKELKGKVRVPCLHPCNIRRGLGILLSIDVQLILSPGYCPGCLYSTI